MQVEAGLKQTRAHNLLSGSGQEQRHGSGNGEDYLLCVGDQLDHDNLPTGFDLAQ